MSQILHDNGGRRLGVQRREFSYQAHIPERRSGKDRRSENDRRLKQRISKDLFFTSTSFRLKQNLKSQRNKGGDK